MTGVESLKLISDVLASVDKITEEGGHQGEAGHQIAPVVVIQKVL